jgi:hypothetical protein
VKRSPNVLQWFLNLFRKNKIKKRMFFYKWGYPDNIHKMEEMESFLQANQEYEYKPYLDVFYEKAHVVIWYSDYNHGNEIRYFDTDKEAKEFFDKIIAYAKQTNVPFLNFYAE